MAKQRETAPTEGPVIDDLTDVFTHDGDTGGKVEFGLPLPSLDGIETPTDRAERAFREQVARMQDRDITFKPNVVHGGKDYAKTQVDRYRTPVDPDDETRLANGLPRLTPGGGPRFGRGLARLTKVRRRKVAGRRPGETHMVDVMADAGPADCTVVRYSAEDSCKDPGGASCPRWHRHKKPPSFVEVEHGTPAEPEQRVF